MTRSCIGESDSLRRCDRGGRKENTDNCSDRSLNIDDPSVVNDSRKSHVVWLRLIPYCLRLDHLVRETTITSCNSLDRRRNNRVCGRCSTSECKCVSTTSWSGVSSSSCKRARSSGTLSSSGPGFFVLPADLCRLTSVG